MMSYEMFEKKCLECLIKDRKSDHPEKLREYIREDDSQILLKHFYQEGVYRFENGTKHDDEIAFSYCISTAVENLSLIF